MQQTLHSFGIICLLHLWNKLIQVSKVILSNTRAGNETSEARRQMTKLQIPQSMTWSWTKLDYTHQWEKWMRVAWLAWRELLKKVAVDSSAIGYELWQRIDITWLTSKLKLIIRQSIQQSINSSSQLARKPRFRLGYFDKVSYAPCWKHRRFNSSDCCTSVASLESPMSPTRCTIHFLFIDIDKR